jgi:hypothetical protein
MKREQIVEKLRKKNGIKTVGHFKLKAVSYSENLEEIIIKMYEAVDENLKRCDDILYQSSIKGKIDEETQGKQYAYEYLTNKFNTILEEKK